MDALPEVARRLCRNLGKIRAGRPAQAPIARVETPWGAFTFQAHPLSQTDHGRDALVTGVPPPVVDTLRLTCPGLVVTETPY